ncbi:MAG: hypothetical protein KF716_24450 [Anaerolineae bacterium]|nr:hypothetical protein [Anaerolineae bacterium]
MKYVPLLIIPLLLVASSLIIGSQTLGQTHTDRVHDLGFGWCDGTPCYTSKIAITTLRDQLGLPTIGDFVRSFGAPCGLRMMRGDCSVDQHSLQPLCRPRQVAVLYPSMLITAVEVTTDHGALFTAEQATENITLAAPDYNYCELLRINDVTWRGFQPLEHYWP